MGHETQESVKTSYSRHADLTLAFNVFGDGMQEFINEQMAAHLGLKQWFGEASAKLGRAPEYDATDPYFQLLVIKRFWGPVFSHTYQTDLRPIIDELIEARNLWAHFSISNDVTKLDRAVIIMERLLAPVNPDAAVTVRTSRYKLKHPRTEDELAPTPEQKAELHNKLAKAKRSAEAVSERNSELSKELAQSRRTSANKQLKLSGLENQLAEIQSKADALEIHISEQRNQHDRIEWLFASFLVVIVIAMVLVTGIR